MLGRVHEQLTEGAVNFRIPGKRGRDGLFGHPMGTGPPRRYIRPLHRSTAGCTRPSTSRASCVSTPSSSSSSPRRATLSSGRSSAPTGISACTVRRTRARTPPRRLGADMYVTPEVFNPRVLVTALKDALRERVGVSAGNEGDAAEVKEVTLREVDAAAFASACPLSEELWCNMGTSAHTACTPARP
ncbi:hypothetical protein DFH11DRAFT_113312 [Phellopilus nigrolimitatus]|nr:hypothetical protein DFH11DRAFT_113312 [Phellopilus nigrolimitatus]